jgi:hypothetical protein
MPYGSRPAAIIAIAGVKSPASIADPERMSSLLIGLGIVAVVLALTTPWESDQEAGAGPKAHFLVKFEEEMSSHGMPDSVTDCFVDGLDGELTDADAEILNSAFGPVVSRPEAEADPEKRALVEALGGVAIDCAPEMAEASGPGTPAAEAAAYLDSLR